MVFVGTGQEGKRRGHLRAIDAYKTLDGGCFEKIETVVNVGWQRRDEGIGKGQIATGKVDGYGFVRNGTVLSWGMQERDRGISKWQSALTNLHGLCCMGNDTVVFVSRSVRKGENR